MKRRKRKVRKLKIGRVMIALGLLVLICLVIIYLFKDDEGAVNHHTTEKSNNVYEKNIEKEEEKTYSVSVITAGDNLIHSSIYKDASVGYNEYDFKPMYELIKPIVSKYDIAYYNQETILGGKELGVADYPTFNSPQEVGDAMIDAGFNLVSLATNHTMDSGERAVLKSREYWNSKTDVMAVGSYSSFEERDKVVIATKNNISYTMLNYTYGTNGIAVPKGKEYLVNVWPTDLDINDPDKDDAYQAYKSQVKTDVDRVRDKVDVLIVAMHWGVEYTHEPTAYEKDMAKYLASLGVDVIIGTHPHVIQPIEWIDNTLVIYSLGNFISAQYQNQGTCLNYKCMTGLMTRFDIEKTVKGKKTEIKIKNINNELIYTYYSSWRNFKVIPFSNSMIKDKLYGYQNVYDTYKDVVIKYDKTIPVAECYQ